MTSTIAFEESGLNEHVGGYDDWVRQSGGIATSALSTTAKNADRGKQTAAIAPAKPKRRSFQGEARTRNPARDHRTARGRETCIVTTSSWPEPVGCMPICGKCCVDVWTRCSWRTQPAQSASGDPRREGTQARTPTTQDGGSNEVDAGSGRLGLTPNESENS